MRLETNTNKQIFEKKEFESKKYAKKAKLMKVV